MRAIRTFRAICTILGIVILEKSLFLGLGCVQGMTTPPPEMWGYAGKTGPAFWCRILRNTHCCGLLQSPVDINTHSVRRLVSSFAPLYFENYNVPVRLNVTNNGRTIHLHPTAEDHLPKLSGGPLQGKYVLENIHFHWGSSSKKGSEHTINGKRFPLEMHLFHKNMRYKTVEEARKFFDGLAVISVLFKLSKMDNINFKEIIQALTRVTYKGETDTTHKPVKLKRLLPKELDDYHTYFGSETTPPCSVSVTWIIMEDQGRIGCVQIKAFRNLRRETAENDPDYKMPLVNNFRPSQDLNHRPIFEIEED